MHARRSAPPTQIATAAPRTPTSRPSQLPMRLELGAATFLLSLLAISPASADVGRWTTGGPEGGSINALVADPKVPGVLYAATPFSGVLKSTSGGAFWTLSNQGLSGPFLPDSISIHSIAIDPQTTAT